MSVSLSIIIVSYNVRYFLEQCLYSVRRSGMGLRVEVIVVDNGSADGSIEYLKPLFPEVKFIAAGSNLGFAKASNLGYRQATGSHILFLNPDVLLAEETLHVALQFLRCHGDAGAVGVRMVDGGGRFLKESKRGFPSPLTSLYKLCGLAGLFPRSARFSRYYLGHLNEHQNHCVEVLAGAFMMLPRKVLEKVGLFDEAFFMYGEDIDLSYRIRQAGYRNYYLAETTILHFKGESTPKPSLRYVRLFYGAMGIFVRKHYGGSYAGVLVLLLQAGIWLRALLTLLAAAAKKIIVPQEARSPKTPIAVLAGARDYSQLAAGLHGRGIDTLHLKSLHNAVLLEKNQELVLCVSGKPVSAYISWIQQQHLSLQYRFHYPGSGSIVGSSVAGRKGGVLVLSRSTNAATVGPGFVN